MHLRGISMVKTHDYHDYHARNKGDSEGLLPSRLRDRFSGSG
jgi:hypothetical protein